MVVEGERVVVGDVNRPEIEVGYEMLCRRHHMRRMTATAAPTAALSLDVMPIRELVSVNVASVTSRYGSE
jgi:thymidine kinase